MKDQAGAEGEYNCDFMVWACFMRLHSLLMNLRQEQGFKDG